MKNKWVWIVLVILLLLAGSAAAYYKLALKSPQTATKTEEERGGVFKTIQDALSRNLTLRCQFTSDDGMTTTAYVKMGQIRIDSNVGKPTAASMIMKDKKVWYWQVAQKTGTVMTIPSVTVSPVPTSSVKQAATASGEDKGASTLAMLEKFKDSCKVASVADSLFVPPADVKFTDASEMMKQIPSGIPSGMSQQDIQNVMQRYATPTGY